MILCIDSGNTRIKWGTYQDGQWLDKGTLAHTETGELRAIAMGSQTERIIFANVAGQAVGEALRKSLANGHAPLTEARTRQTAGGVHNGYENPQKLGVDRWSALIGARALTQTTCLVVMAGTATTIDSLDSEGNFPGGLILPGIDLMRRSLARDTAALPLASGHHAEHPKNTDDAIISGCLEAQAGAIERAFARISRQTGAICLISGGAAMQLTPLLGIPFIAVDNLVLEGLARLASTVE